MKNKSLNGIRYPSKLWCKRLSFTWTVLSKSENQKKLAIYFLVGGICNLTR